MAPPQQLRQQTSNCSLLLIYRPRKDERLSWPSWLTYSGRFTHISGQPSATGRAQIVVVKMVMVETVVVETVLVMVETLMVLMVVVEMVVVPKSCCLCCEICSYGASSFASRDYRQQPGDRRSGGGGGGSGGRPAGAGGGYGGNYGGAYGGSYGGSSSGSDWWGNWPPADWTYITEFR